MRLIIVSNRLPLTVTRKGGKFEYKETSGGLVTGLKAVKETLPFLWIGNISGLVLSESEKKTIASDCWELYKSVPVFIGAELNEASYNGFCNGILWPAVHTFSDDASFDSRLLASYRAFNRQFADAILEHAKPDDTIWVHDYHLMLLPEMLRQVMPTLKVGFFLHTPFPPADIFLTLPCSKELVKGVLGADLVGLHTIDYAAHFLDTARAVLENMIPEDKNDYEHPEANESEIIKRTKFFKKSRTSKADMVVSQSMSDSSSKNLNSKVVFAKKKTKNNEKSMKGCTELRNVSEIASVNQKQISNMNTDEILGEDESSDTNQNPGPEMSTRRLDTFSSKGIKLEYEKENKSIFTEGGIEPDLESGKSMSYENIKFNMNDNGSKEEYYSSRMSLSHDGRITAVQATSIGIDPKLFSAALHDVQTSLRIQQLRESVAGRPLVVGVDRTDYIKGIPQRIRGFEKVLKDHDAAFMQVCVPSRLDVPEYASLMAQIYEQAATCNSKGPVSDVPLRLRAGSVSHDELCALYAAADVLIVSSLMDGMNLVALEFVACQNGRGVLMLSEFAGCAATLPGAVLFNPWNEEDIARAFVKCFDMGEKERKERFELNRRNVEKFTALKWAQDNIESLKKINN